MIPPTKSEETISKHSTRNMIYAQVIQLAREHNSRTLLTAITYTCLPHISTILSTLEETTKIGPLLRYARRV